MYPPPSRFGPAEATDVLERILIRPHGADTALGAFADVPGMQYVAARKGGFLRSEVPTRLQVGDHDFASAGPYGLVVRHVVRDVVLLSETLDPTAAARRLAQAVLDSAERYGEDADMATQSVFFGLSSIAG